MEEEYNLCFDRFEANVEKWIAMGRELMKDLPHEVCAPEVLMNAICFQGESVPSASIPKLFWSEWDRKLSRGINIQDLPLLVAKLTHWSKLGWQQLRLKRHGQGLYTLMGMFGELHLHTLLSKVTATLSEEMKEVEDETAALYDRCVELKGLLSKRYVEQQTELIGNHFVELESYRSLPTKAQEFICEHPLHFFSREDLEDCMERSVEIWKRILELHPTFIVTNCSRLLNQPLKFEGEVEGIKITITCR